MLVTTDKIACPSTQIQNISYQIVHSYTGRLRIRLSILAYDLDYAKKLKCLVSGVPYVTSVRINPAARSVIIEYNYEVSEDIIDIIKLQVFTAIQEAASSDIARETADVVLMENNLRDLVHAIRIAKDAMNIIWQNVAIVAVPNISALISGIVFALDPILAVVINNGTAILAELNGLRPLIGPGVPGPSSLGPAKQTIEVSAQSNASNASLSCVE